MDEQRFDHLSRRFAGFRTRRQALKAIAGAVVATVAGARGTAAQDCTPPYSSCGSDDECCAGAVCQYGLCMPGCRIDGAFQNAWTSPPGDVCNQCLPDISTTSWSPANEGMSCWSGDPNAGTTYCQAGICVPAGPAGCPPPPACHTDELIDPATCTYAAADAGTVCGNGPLCHGEFFQPADVCDGNGFCIGGGSRTTSCAPYACGDGACNTTCEGDGDCTAGATCCGGSCITLGGTDHCAACGDACTPVDACTPASCDNGTCNQASACGPVDACTPAQCLDGGACNQLSACTGNTVCDGGVCVSICLELGAIGCSRPEPDECCAHVFPDGALTSIYCGNGICGGPGARCGQGPGDVTCATGVCCGHPGGEVCCAANEACVSEGCIQVTCLEHGDNCESADQCCGEGQTCGPRAGNTSETECCYELGAAGCEGSGSGDCCAHIYAEGGDSPVRCGNGICGGPGARCDPENGVHLCASGLCCGEDVDGGFCCAENEACVENECVPVTCLELGDDCETADQCCGEGQTCGARVENINETECCFELGASGCTGSDDGDCCLYIYPGGGAGHAISCGNGICGGPGAYCTFGWPEEDICASGTCCGYNSVGLGVCCAEHEACIDNECVSTCLELGDACDTAGQCCGEGQACAPVESESVNECCLEIGAIGCTGTDFEDCCSHIFPDGGLTLVFCGNGACGGPGARCNPASGDTTCASGTCCGDVGMGACCADGEQCVNGECVPE